MHRVASPLRESRRSISCSRVTSTRAPVQMLGLSADYPKTRNDKVNAVTMEDISRVAKRLLKPENLSFVVVGEPTGVEATE